MNPQQVGSSLADILIQIWICPEIRIQIPLLVVAIGLRLGGGVHSLSAV